MKQSGDAGRLIVFAGPACSGKSVLAAALARRLGAPHLQMDTTRARLMPEAAHTRADRRVAYRAMAFAAELLAGCGQTVILDAPYGHPEDRAEIREVLCRTGAAFSLIECRVDPALAARRFDDRPANHPGRDLTRERVIELGRTYPYSGKGLSLDTGAQTPDECSRVIDDYLKNPGAPQADNVEW